MIGLLLRKTLYDFWDNMFRIVLVNLGLLLIVGVLGLLVSGAVKLMEHIGTDSFILETILYGIGIFICSIYLAASSFSLRSISDYGVFGFADFFKNIKRSWKSGIAMGVFVFIMFIAVTVILPFYLAMDSIIGLALAAIVFWLMVFALSSFQYFFSVYTRLGGKVFKSIKKCIILCFDNTGFTIFLFLHNLIVVILMILSMTMPFLMVLILLPGPAGIFLYIDQALRLRLLKYDWLEANPTANRKKIPWEDLLVEEREKVGHRTFRNFIFPWKD